MQIRSLLRDCKCSPFFAYKNRKVKCKERWNITGGRGASFGGGPKAVEIKIGNTTVTYRDRGKGKITGLNNMDINKSVKGKSITDLVKMAKEKGYKYKTYNSKQLAENDKAYKKQREAADKQLDRAWYEAAPKPRKGWKGH